MPTLLLLLILVSTALSAALTLALTRLGRRARLLDTAGAGDHRKANLRRVPNIGGVAIFWTVAGVIGAGLVAGWTLDAEAVASRLPALADADEILAGVRRQTPMALALLACLGALHAMGLFDDRRALGALPKLGVMLLASVVLVLGFDVRMLELLDAPAGGTWASILVTILWLVAITNAMNFLDNMDGVAAGVGAVAGGCFLLTATLNAQWFVAGILAGLVGALLGFLVFNRPRASIFMGDGGSLVVGFLLAFLTVRMTYRGAGEPWHAIFMPLCVLAVPLYDLVTVSVIRLSQGRSPLVGDQQHFTHRMRARGLSDWRVLGVICGLAAITGLSGIILGRVAGRTAPLVGAQVVLTLAVLALYEHGAARREASS